MKRLFILALLLALPAMATNRTVKSGGGGTCTEIQTCVNLMANGDTTTIFAGTYITGADASGITVADGGVGAYRTIQVNGDDLVTVLSFTLGSHNKLLGGNTARPTTTGLHIENTANPTNRRCVTLPDAGTDIYVVNSHMYACSGAIRSSTVSGAPSYIYFQGNTTLYPCSTSASPDVCLTGSATGDHWLLEGNDISHASDGFTFTANWSAFRNNILHDFVHTDCNPTFSNTSSIAGTTFTKISGTSFLNVAVGEWVRDANDGTTRFTILTVAVDGSSITVSGSPTASASVAITGGNGSNCHFDYTQSEPAASQHQLIEGNYGYNNEGGGPIGNGHGFLTQADVCAVGACHDVIIRLNTIAHFASGGIVDDNARRVGNGTGFTNVKSYNNSWVDASTGGVNAFTWKSNNASSINDIYYFPQAMASGNPYMCSESSDPTNNSYACGTFVGKNNLGFCTTDGTNLASPCNLQGDIYSTGSFTTTVTNQISNPKFTNYAGADYSLQSSSPARLAGGAQTVIDASDSGSGTSLVVADAGYFFDGGTNNNTQTPITAADWVCVGATPLSNCSQITYITYGVYPISIGTLHTVNALSRSAADPVYLYKDSNGRVLLTSTSIQKPNLGAFPDSVSPSTIAFGTQQTSTTSATQTVTLSNWTAAPFTITSVVNSDGTHFPATDNCTALSPLPIGGNCTVTVAFSPTLVQAYTGTITFTDAAGDSPQVVSLSGTGTNSLAPVATLTRTPATGAIAPRSTFTLTWAGTNTPTSATINGVAVTPAAGGTTAPITVLPGTTTYTLIEANASGSSQAVVTVQQGGTFQGHNTNHGANVVIR
jgi:hypothetical protein